MNKVTFILSTFLLVMGCKSKRNVYVAASAPVCGIEAVHIATSFWNEILKMEVFNVVVVDKLPKKLNFGTVHIEFKKHNGVNSWSLNPPSGYTSLHVARSKIQIELLDEKKHTQEYDKRCLKVTEKLIAHELGHHLRLRHATTERKNLMYWFIISESTKYPSENGWILRKQQIRKARRRAKLWLGNNFN